MEKVTLDDAQKYLPQLVRNLPREGELLITDAGHPVARLMPVTNRTSLRHLKPLSVGEVLRPYPDPQDDILGEMLDGRP